MIIPYHIRTVTAFIYIYDYTISYQDSYSFYLVGAQMTIFSHCCKTRVPRLIWHAQDINHV